MNAAVNAQVFSNKYLLINIFLFCDEPCRNVVFNVSQSWRKYYRWVHPRESYLGCIYEKNFKLANELFDHFGFEFSNDVVLIRALFYEELTPHVLKMLTFKHIDPTINNNMAIRMAACSGNLAMVNKLLENLSVDPCAHCNGAIEGALRNKHTDVAKRLLEDPRIDPGYRMFLPLFSFTHATPTAYSNRVDFQDRADRTSECKIITIE